MSQNEMRAKRGYSALRSYKENQLKEDGVPGVEDLTDLLADMMHHLGPDAVLDSAKTADAHYSAERGAVEPESAGFAEVEYTVLEDLYNDWICRSEIQEDLLQDDDTKDLNRRALAAIAAEKEVAE